MQITVRFLNKFSSVGCCQTKLSGKVLQKLQENVFNGTMEGLHRRCYPLNSAKLFLKASRITDLTYSIKHH